MKIYIDINNRELEVENIEKLKKHLKYLSEYIEIYQDTNDIIYFNFPNDIFKVV